MTMNGICKINIPRDTEYSDIVVSIVVYGHRVQSNGDRMGFKKFSQKMIPTLLEASKEECGYNIHIILNDIYNCHCMKALTPQLLLFIYF